MKCDIINVKYFIVPPQIHFKLGFTGLQKVFEMLILQELRFVMLMSNNKLIITVLSKIVY